MLASLRPQLSTLSDFRRSSPLEDAHDGNPNLRNGTDEPPNRSCFRYAPLGPIAHWSVGRRAAGFLDRRLEAGVRTKAAAINRYFERRPHLLNEVRLAGLQVKEKYERV
jgi:hypothetical protein